MKMRYTMSYLVADIVVEVNNGILIKRRHNPFKDYCALPAGFVGLKRLY